MELRGRSQRSSPRVRPAAEFLWCLSTAGRLMRLRRLNASGSALHRCSGDRKCAAGTTGRNGGTLLRSSAHRLGCATKIYAQANEVSVHQCGVSVKEEAKDPKLIGKSLSRILVEEAVSRVCPAIILGPFPGPGLHNYFLLRQKQTKPEKYFLLE